MKTLAAIAIPLVLLLTYAFTTYDEPEVEKFEKSSSEVYAIHELEINQDVDSKEFETFVMNELAPIINKMKGQKLILVKGDRGVRTNKYAIILTFESIEDRNKIYPPSGEMVGDFGDEKVWDKFFSMSSGLGISHTDYVVVAH